MIVSKSNLLVWEITKDAKGLDLLQNVHIAKDGSSVALGNKSILIVSPISKEMKENSVIEDNDRTEEMTIPVDTIKNVITNIPPDKQFGGVFELVSLQKTGFENKKVKILINDGKKEYHLTGNLYARDYVEYSKSFKRGLRGGLLAQRVSFDLKRLKTLFETILKICNDGSNDIPVFLDFCENGQGRDSGGDIVVRCQNPSTKQRCVGMIRSYKENEEKWMQLDAWENSFLEDKKTLKKITLQKKKKLRLKLK